MTDTRPTTFITHTNPFPKLCEKQILTLSHVGKSLAMNGRMILPPTIITHNTNHNVIETFLTIDLDRFKYTGFVIDQVLVFNYHSRYIISHFRNQHKGTHVVASVLRTKEEERTGWIVQKVVKNGQEGMMKSRIDLPHVGVQWNNVPKVEIELPWEKWYDVYLSHPVEEWLIDEPPSLV